MKTNAVRKATPWEKKKRRDSDTLIPLTTQHATTRPFSQRTAMPQFRRTTASYNPSQRARPSHPTKAQLHSLRETPGPQTGLFPDSPAPSAATSQRASFYTDAAESLKALHRL